jgi:hypothetical protein
MNDDAPVGPAAVHIGPDAEGAEMIAAARRRGLGSRPALRCAANVGWSAFIGASLALITMLLVPEGWLDAPVEFGRLSLLFLGLWTLALVPALSAALLSRSLRSSDAR